MRCLCRTHCRYFCRCNFRYLYRLQGNSPQDGWCNANCADFDAAAVSISPRILPLELRVGHRPAPSCVSVSARLGRSGRVVRNAVRQRKALRTPQADAANQPGQQSIPALRLNPSGNLQRCPIGQKPSDESAGGSPDTNTLQANFDSQDGPGPTCSTSSGKRARRSMTARWISGKWVLPVRWSLGCVPCGILVSIHAEQCPSEYFAVVDLVDIEARYAADPGKLSPYNFRTDKAISWRSKSWISLLG